MVVNGVFEMCVQLGGVVCNVVILGCIEWSGAMLNGVACSAVVWSRMAWNAVSLNGVVDVRGMEWSGTPYCSGDSGGA